MLSTTKAEYTALSHKAIWLRQPAMDLKCDPKKPTVVYKHNQSVICFSQNPQPHGRSKHIKIKYHFVREQVSKGNIELKYCPTENMVADMLMKGLEKQRFEKLRKMAGISEQSSCM